VPTMTHAPTEGECPYTFLSCGDVITDTTIKGDCSGKGCKDSNFLMAVYQPTTMIFTTCFRTTEFESVLTLYDRCPSQSTRVTVQDQDPNFFCGKRF